MLAGNNGSGTAQNFTQAELSYFYLGATWCWTVVEVTQDQRSMFDVSQHEGRGMVSHEWNLAGFISALIPPDPARVVLEFRPLGQSRFVSAPAMEGRGK